MELNDIHQGQLSRLGSFLKGKRERALLDREAEKEDFKSDRLTDETAIYNFHDVTTLLESYHAEVMVRLREQMEATAGLSAVFAAHLMAQAEQMGMSLQVDDISAIEDQSRLDQVHALAAMNAPPLAPKPRHTLAAMDSGATADPVVLQQMADLQEENRRMQDRNHQMMVEITQAKTERSTLSAELEQVKANFKQHLAMKHEEGGGDSGGAHLAEYERALAESHQQLQAKHVELEQMRKEMGQRLGDSNQFRDLKSLVKRKSDEVKVLRDQLASAGLVAQDGDACVELEADSD